MSNISQSKFTPGSAYWNQRSNIQASKSRLLELSRAVGRQSDMLPYQFAQLFASAMEFQPDLILELGRGFGNSTCAFTEAANQLAPTVKTRVVSICNSLSWGMHIKQLIAKIVPPTWFSPLETLTTDILTFDYETCLKDAKRILLFWDAHGFDIAERVLGTILPLLADRPHIILMHDLSDARYNDPLYEDYGERGLWQGESAGEARFRIGIVDSAVAQAISVMDFTNRNHLTLDSADHSFDLELSKPGRVEEMKKLLGEELFSLQGHWFWFTLNEKLAPYTFPKLNPAQIESQKEIAANTNLSIFQKFRILFRYIFTRKTS